MIIIKLKEPQTCSLCLKIIEVSKECFRFFNHIHKVPEEIKPGYLVGRGFMIHFRHLECQYKKDKRSGSLEEYIVLIKAQLEQQKEKKKPKLKPTWVKFRAPYKGYEHIQTSR
jgi:hypothetical protein